MPPTPRRRRRQPVRAASPQPGRTSTSASRRIERSPETVDYSLDYAYARHDLKRVLLWSSLLFVGMVAVYFVMSAV